MRGLWRPATLNDIRRTLRRTVAFYSVSFLLAVAAAPHHHLNSLDDLLSDGPSDSGVILQVEGAFQAGHGPQLHPVRLVDDEPCPACFPHDFASVAGHWFQDLETPELIANQVQPRKPILPRAFPEAPASRSPPPAA